MMEQVQSVIEQAFAYGDHSVRVYGTPDNPWFRGNDVAEVLGYARPKRAIEDHVDEDEKLPFSKLIEMAPSQGHLVTTNKIILKTMYINESGLYSLIMKSRLADAKKFKKWVTAEVLPSIRRKGQYIDLSRDQEIERLRQELKEKNDALVEFERKADIWDGYIYNFEQLEKKQFFYIATTVAYAKQNRFKFGGVSKEKDLLQRLGNYNTGRAENDLYYYCKLFKCNNYKLIEERMHNVLSYCKDKRGSRKEMVILRFDALCDIADFICENYDKEINYINEKCMQYIQLTVSETPIVPEPVRLANYTELKLLRNGEEEKRIDVSKLSSSELHEIISQIVEKCAQKEVPQYSISRDKDVVKVNLFWRNLTELMRQYSGYTLTQWRATFKDWYMVNKPKQLYVKGVAVKKIE